MTTDPKLNEELLKIAEDDFSTFCSIVGLSIEHAYVCLLRQQGKSYGEIAIKLKMTKAKVRGIYVRNCDCK